MRPEVVLYQMAAFIAGMKEANPKMFLFEAGHKLNKYAKAYCGIEAMPCADYLTRETALVYSRNGVGMAASVRVSKSHGNTLDDCDIEIWIPLEGVPAWESGVFSGVEEKINRMEDLLRELRAITSSIHVKL